MLSVLSSMSRMDSLVFGVATSRVGGRGGVDISEEGTGGFGASGALRVTDGSSGVATFRLSLSGLSELRKPTYEIEWSGSLYCC